VLAVLLIAAGIAVFGGDGSTGSVYAETTEASPVTSTATKSSAERPAVTPARSVSEPSTWPNTSSAAARGKGKGRGPKSKNSGQRTVGSQELTNEGYVRMQRGDYAGAEAAFSEALEIDPSNDSARKGLQAARTAQTVQGVARVLGR
jgi:tetratricopeptide (TPR) repeat protein